MANSGVIQQFKVPFEPNTILDIPSESYCRIGISIGETDLMAWSVSHSDGSLKVLINNELILIGQTFMYETNYPIGDLGKVYTTIGFPEGAPESTIVNIAYSDKPYEYPSYVEEEEE